MSATLEVYDENGKIIYTSEQGVAKVMGTMTVSGTGSRTFNAMDGEAINNLFAYFTPHVQSRFDRTTVLDALWCEGNTLHWLNVNIGGRVVTFGDAFV